MCGTNFKTSREKEGCRIDGEQKGEFNINVSDSKLCIELVDTIGMNCKDPGEWQKQLHNILDIHGIIFYINGSNPRESALGDLPRFIQYCHNLHVPMMFMYRDGELNYFKDKGESVLIDTVCDKTTKEVNHNNLDFVKTTIANRFSKCTNLHKLTDPIEVGKIIRKLEKCKTDLQKSNADLNQQNKELSKYNQDLNEQVTAANEEYQRLGADFNKETTIFREQIDKMHREYTTKDKDLVRLQAKNHNLSKETERLTTVKNNLESDKNNLENWKTKINKIIRDTIDHLNQNLHTIGEIQSVQNQRRVKPKKYSATFLMPLVPGYGYAVIQEYDALGDKIADLINYLQTKLSEIENTD